MTVSQSNAAPASGHECGATRSKWHTGHMRTVENNVLYTASKPRTRAFCIMETLGIIFALVILHAVLGEPMRKLDTLMPTLKNAGRSVVDMLKVTNMLTRPDMHEFAPSSDGHFTHAPVRDAPYVCDGLSSALPSVNFVDPRTGTSQVQTPVGATMYWCLHIAWSQCSSGLCLYHCAPDLQGGPALVFHGFTCILANDLGISNTSSLVVQDSAVLSKDVLDALSAASDPTTAVCGHSAGDVTLVVMLYHKMGTVWWQHALRVTDFVSPLSMFVVDSGKGMEVCSEHCLIPTRL